MLKFTFLDNITDLKTNVREDNVARGIEVLIAKSKQSDNEDLIKKINTILVHPSGKTLLGMIFSYSPFLTKIIQQYPGFFVSICIHGSDKCFEELKASLSAASPHNTNELMKTMRVAKGKASLLIALSDIAGLWTLEKVTSSMSDFAEICVRLTLSFLLNEAAQKNDIILPHPENPQKDSAIFVLAMGKLGARELNYSSDIDLIVFFDKERVHYPNMNNVQHYFSKMTHEMVRILQERTADGYVFRVDLRLRPDPASTPAAMSIAGAITYYETVGQNWERAAFIKARPIAGDMEAGYQFLKQISPFIWRKNLDFAAIADIQSIKRQMDEKTGRDINIPGHNVKTGIGGIREIEFFAQIHQLIWGGRIPQLRISNTCKTLEALANNELISLDLAKKLIDSYRFLRTTEHRLQMIEDQQTHSIPVAMEAREQFSRFMGFGNNITLENELLIHLNFVHENFSGAFRGQGRLSGDEGKLSFTGVENDPHTLETLTKMGYSNPASVSELIQSWHRGARRATRTKRARELITELTPTLLKAFAATVKPDQAFIRFDEFLSKLPAGVQLFSLFNANPQLLTLLALIMGSAPAMAETLSKNPNLLDSVLTGAFYDDFQNKAELFNEVSNQLLLARDFEDEMDIIRRFKNEKQFQAGVQLIRHQVTSLEVSNFLSDIAETCLEAMLHRVEIHFKNKHPDLQLGCLATIALGRLGAREMTFGSDIDLVFVYKSSDKKVQEQNHIIYNKLCQRFISALTALTREGRLYEVDTRLRPSGKDGLLVVSTDAFDKYFSESAWTFEIMAFTRARVITGDRDLRNEIGKVITANIIKKRAKETLIQDIIDLRSKITKEFGSNDPWNLKYAHGGIMDLDFLAQYFVLLHANQHPDIIINSTGKVFERLVSHDLISNTTGKALFEAHRFLNSLFALLRLCGGGILDESTAPQGLKDLITTNAGLPNFDSVKDHLLATLETVRKYYSEFINPNNI